MILEGMQTFKSEDGMESIKMINRVKQNEKQTTILGLKNDRCL